MRDREQDRQRGEGDRKGGEVLGGMFDRARAYHLRSAGIATAGTGYGEDLPIFCISLFFLSASASLYMPYSAEMTGMSSSLGKLARESTRTGTCRGFRGQEKESRGRCRERESERILGEPWRVLPSCGGVHRPVSGLHTILRGHRSDLRCIEGHAARGPHISQLGFSAASPRGGLQWRLLGSLRPQRAGRLRREIVPAGHGQREPAAACPVGCAA